MSDGTDLGLSVPIAGVQLIEASAGTGKTFTIETLYSRLVIDSGLPVSAILAVTFTEAATRELRQRLRARLVLAQQLVDANSATGMTDAQGAVDAFDEIASDDEATRLTRQLVRAAAQRDGLPALRQRLRRAGEQMDQAPIHTIHGFCRRALADHALEAGQALVERELITNEAELRREVALEFWREISRDPVHSETLSSIWSSPELLADSLRELLGIDVLLPLASIDDGLALAALTKAREQLAQAFDAHGALAREHLRQACAEGSVNATIVKDAAVDPVWKALNLWRSGTLAGDPPTDKLGNYASSCLRTKTNKGKRTPVSPLFDAIEHWSQAANDNEGAARERRIALVHRARDFAATRMRELKRERGLLGFDDMIRDVAEALDGSRGELFARRLQAQYAVALVDEFQDTDARQWAIFRRLFAAVDNHDGISVGVGALDDGASCRDPWPVRALFLIGDPKQAIYRFRGGDVFTYLAAAQHADGKHRLQRNFRSRPSALAAMQAVFEMSAGDAFAQAGIAFESVQAGGRCQDHDLQVDGAIAPALQLLLLDCQEKESVEISRERATVACVASIHALLAAGLDDRAQLVDRHGQRRAVAPADIAVLVEKNDDAERIQRALSRAGIPSVAAGRRSIYATEEAQHLCYLFEAMLAPADDQRLRAALAMPLFGLSAADLLAFDTDESAHRAWQDRLQHWQHQTQRFGPMALLGAVCAEQALRLLGWPDGERRISNYLQLAEELQAADAHAPGLAGLLSALEQRMHDADDANDAELLRLDSDAERVRILTLHMSKGLEFELVFLPYAATGGGERRSGKPDMARFHDGERRVAQLYPIKGEPACQTELAEERAERLRLLYVGLTRARLATWLAWGPANQAEKTALAWLLHRAPGAATADKVTAASVRERLQQLQARAPNAIAVVDAPSSGDLPRLDFANPLPTPSAAVAARVLDRDWWVYSFSQLASEDSGVDALAADDEIDSAPVSAYSVFSGTRFGNSLHAALENIIPEQWLGWTGALPPTGQFDVVADALRDAGYSAAAELDEGVPLLTGLISETLNVRMPEGARLAALPAAARRNEMEFHFALAPTRVAEILAVMHRFGIVSQRQGFGARRRLEGLLTGRIDLVYEFEQRFYLLDYKSNRLPAYDAPTLADAVRDSEYDLQYVLYSLALHRWLRWRLGAQYDIERHLGGVRYLFCRGLDRQRDDAPGIHALTLPTGLIEALDDLLQAEPA